MKTVMNAAIATSLLILPVFQVQAHGIYFTERSKQIVLVYGEGADDLDMVKREPLIDAVTAYDAEGTPIKAEHRLSGLAMLVEAESSPAFVSAVLQNGVWSRMKGGEYEKKGLDEMPGAEVSTNNIKYAVRVQGALAGPVPLLSGQTLQIVPVGPIPKLLGQKLKYKVLFKEQPVAGARLINDFVNDPDAKEIVTGADGIAIMPLRNQGLNVIHAVYDGPSDNPAKYRNVEHTATLSFTLEHKPE